MESIFRTQVLIVGAGPAGLATAIELGRRGIRCLVVERNDRVGYAPRSKTTNIRTREHLRRWGIADRLRDRSPLGIDYPSNIVFSTRLNGHLLAKIDNAFYCNPARDDRYAEHAQWIPQYTLEDVLREFAESLPGVQIRFQHEMKDFVQHPDRIVAKVLDRLEGVLREIACDYLVGADGARSRVRDLIGARMEGKPSLSRNYNSVVHAPGLARAHDFGPAIMYWQVNSDLPALIGPMDSGDRYFFMPTYVPEGMNMTPEEVPGQIYRATGIDLPYKVLSSDEWTASQLVADRYRDRRAFLVGDACHLHPPFGGYGMNMGVADGVDLGWKMASVLQGWGGASMLDTYQTERRPVHQYVIDEAVANHAVLGNQLLHEDIEQEGATGDAVRQRIGDIIRESKEREFHAIGVVKGYRYENSPIIVSDGEALPALDWREYLPSAHPGRIAPHAWLEDGSSLYDHFGDGYTLLYAGDASDQTAAGFAIAAQRAGMPLTLLPAPRTDIAGRYGAKYALIRPDQHVAWRGNQVADPAALLSKVCGQTDAAKRS